MSKNILVLFFIITFSSFKLSASESPILSFSLEQRQSSVSVYPNPAVSFAKVKSEKLFVNITKVEVVDIVGNPMFQINSNSSIVNLNVSRLNKGKYFIKVSFSDNTQEVTQFIKQ